MQDAAAAVVVVATTSFVIIVDFAAFNSFSHLKNMFFFVLSEMQSHQIAIHVH